MEDQKTLAELTEEEKELVLPEMIKSEVNFLIFPFFALSRYGLKDKTETEYWEVIKRGDEKLEILWNVSANPKYGYPGPFDREVHKAIEQIISEILQKNGRVTNPVALGSLGSICRRMGINNYGGAIYKKVKSALERTRAATIKSVGSFYSKEGEEWIDDNFGLYERVVFKGRKLPNGEIADTNYLFLGSRYLQSLNSFYIKPLDYKYLKSLNSKIASRLYEILGIRFYGLQRRKQSNVWFKYETLCQLLPITPQKAFFLAKGVLKKPHEELMDTGFLASAEWKKKSKTEWIIYYYPGKRAKEELKKVQKTALEPEEVSEYLSAPKPPLEAKYEVLEGTSERGRGQEKKDRDQELISQLTQRGISENPAKQLARKYPERIPEKIEIFDWTGERQPEKMKDPAAYLRRMIEEDWPAPEGFVSKAERQRREEEQKKRELRRELKRLRAEMDLQDTKAKLTEGTVEELQREIERLKVERKKRWAERKAKIRKVLSSLSDGEVEALRGEILDRISSFYKSPEKLERIQRADLRDLDPREGLVEAHVKDIRDRIIEERLLRVE